MMLKTETQQINDCLVLRLTGDVQEEDMEVIQGKLLSLSQEKAHRYAIDLGQLSALPLHLTVPLVTLRNAVQEAKEPLILINVPSDFRFILQVAGLDRLFVIIPSTEYLGEKRTAQQTQNQTDPVLKKPVIYDVLQKDRNQS